MEQKSDTIELTRHEVGEYIVRPEPEPNKLVNRRLHGIHVFSSIFNIIQMITIGALFGAGFLVRSALILRLGGPIAVLLSFLLVGFLSWAVMQCIAEVLCIWPISGALMVYVSEFVDPEMGTVCGIAYWYTYSISFAALIAACAAEAAYFDMPSWIEASIIYLMIPLLLIRLNAFGIEVYGFIEIICGVIKLSFYVVVIGAMIAVNAGAGAEGVIHTKYYNATSISNHDGTNSPDYDGTIIVHDWDAAHSWVTALLMSLSIASFAYIGVEVVAATAIEARVFQPNKGSQKPTNIGKTIKFSAIHIPTLIGILYLLGGFMITLNMKWDDCSLQRLVNWYATCEINGKKSPSAFVIIAIKSRIPGLASTMTIFFMLTALMAANTNLYVASRTLFSLCKGLDGHGAWYIRIFAYLGKTSRRHVPLRAMVASCIFVWVPFLHLARSNVPGSSISQIIDVLSQMGSVGAVMVWACQCWAFIRFYHCIDKHRGHLGSLKLVRRWHRGTNEDPEDNYPYRSHFQPYLAYIALIGCLFLLIIANGASLWVGFQAPNFLSAYLAPICFITLWVALKRIRRGPFQLVDLSNAEEVARRIRRLHDIRSASALEQDDERKSRGLWNFWGLV